MHRDEINTYRRMAFHFSSKPYIDAAVIIIGGYAMVAETLSKRLFLKALKHKRGTRPVGTSTAIADVLADYKDPMTIDVLAAAVGESPSTVRLRVEALDNLGIVTFNKADSRVVLNSKWG